MVAFLSASQDIVIDAYRTDLLPEHERASGDGGVSWRDIAWRSSSLGPEPSSSATLCPGPIVYWLLAVLMLLGVVATVFAPIPKDLPPPPPTLKDAVVKPALEFFGREGAWAALVIVTLYKVGDAVAGHMLMDFLIKTGFSKTEIGTVAKGMGVFATIVGGPSSAGGLVAKWGLRWSLLVFGILQALANVLYATLAVAGPDHTLLVLSIGVDNFFGGLGTAAFVRLPDVALRSPLHGHAVSPCSRGLSTVPGRLLGGVGGFLGRSVRMALCSSSLPLRRLYPRSRCSVFSGPRHFPRPPPANLKRGSAVPGFRAIGRNRAEIGPGELA